MALQGDVEQNAVSVGRLVHAQTLEYFFCVLKRISLTGIVKVNPNLPRGNQLCGFDGRDDALLLLWTKGHYSKLTSGASWASASASK